MRNAPSQNLLQYPLPITTNKLKFLLRHNVALVMAMAEAITEGH